MVWARDPRQQCSGDSGEGGVGTVARLEHRTRSGERHQASSNCVLPRRKAGLAWPQLPVFQNSLRNLDFHETRLICELQLMLPALYRQVKLLRPLGCCDSGERTGRDIRVEHFLPRSPLRGSSDKPFSLSGPQCTPPVSWQEDLQGSLPAEIIFSFLSFPRSRLPSME